MRREEGWELDLGARPLDSSRVHFRVWAPHAKQVSINLMGQSELAIRPPVQMNPNERGYFELMVSGVEPGARYRYVLDGQKERPDPASRFQPEGVHGSSEVIDPEAFQWSDDGWAGIPFHQLIIYELHVGTFTREGTFQAIIPFLEYLRHDVGITAIELMPVAQFPGRRNWGYDGVYPFAVQASYGGSDGLKTFVNTCHQKGIAVVLDVVYNHLGPEGNYLGDFGPYFTDRYRTPWGGAINYDGPESDEVRAYFINNALYWVTEFHIDALRLDAIHGIFDFGACHILRELTEAVHAQADRLGRAIHVIGESDLNDARVISPMVEGGYGLDGQWNDDFHHALHTVLTGERRGYYEDFGRLDQLATALCEGFVYSGQRSTFRRRHHGNSSKSRPLSQFIAFSQNHDQVGNRAQGERLSTLVPHEALKVAAATYLLAPKTPLLFMGEEYGERAPFQYFTDHEDPALVEAVRKGRRAEFASFAWDSDVPDPQNPGTFEHSRVYPGNQTLVEHNQILRWYHRLIHLRKSIPALGSAQCGQHEHRVWAEESKQLLFLHRTLHRQPAALIILSFNREPISACLQKPIGTWELMMDSQDVEFGGSGLNGFPATLVIGLKVQTISVPAYGVAVYLDRTPSA
ncbi:MAG TPA: malto-oligosyltrehalose trehalohydrolase [Nitrospiraceae bacterium]|nr:malto-oligosyltrehalose trehalohydrolase [Nitrospiraceae bacterium]